MTRWFEDVVPGEQFDLGSHTFDEAEIIAFAEEYDPQYFHMNPALAPHSHFGGVVASGWHTAAIGHRKMVDALSEEGERIRFSGKRPGVSGPSPGVSRMEFKAPVRPGDTVSYTLTVTGKRPSNSIPGWGLLFNTINAANQHGEPVYLAEFAGFSKLRDYSMPIHLRLLQALTTLPGLRRLRRKGS